MSKIKFLKISASYPNYISMFKSKHPEVENLKYDKALEVYLDDCYAWAYFWKKNLELLGTFECFEIIENAEFLQKKWAKENYVTYSNDDWKKEILIGQIKQIQPDVLFIVDQYASNELSRVIKKIVPSIRLIIGWDGILWHKPETYQYTDIVLTCVPETRDFYIKHGKESYYHKFGFEVSVLDKLKRSEKMHDVTFAGSLVLSQNYHLNRLKLIAELSRKVNLSIYASSLPSNWSFFHRYRLMNTIKTKNYKFAFDLQRVGFKNKGEVFGLDMYQVLFNSKITFNTHGDNSPKTVANMRMTEATGVGSLLLTDWKENIHELFIPDEEIVTYKTVGEAVDKIKMLLKDNVLREKIATKGQQRTFRDYSYQKRMEEFAIYLYKYL